MATSTPIHALVWTATAFAVTLCCSPLAAADSQIPSDPAVKIAMGDDLACALLKSEAVYCWGLADALGPEGSKVPTLPNSRFTKSPVEVNGLPKVKSIAAGRFNYCAIDSDNEAWCWGVDWLASERAKHQVISGPAKVEGLPPVSDIAIGYVHTCAVAASDGAVWCWGHNPAGELGLGSTEPQLKPTKIPSLTGFVSISAGVNNTCAVTKDGDAYCWGTDDQREKAEGFIINSQIPKLVAKLKESEVVGRYISNGRNYACLVRNDKTAVCFGSNIAKQLGNDKVSFYGYATVEKAVGVEKISAGQFSACAIVSGLHLMCWGIPIGVEGASDGSLPTLIAEGGEVIDVSVHGNSACLIINPGIVKCFGSNSGGTIGPDFPIGSYSKLPRRVVGLP